MSCHVVSVGDTIAEHLEQRGLLAWGEQLERVLREAGVAPDDVRVRFLGTRRIRCGGRPWLVELTVASISDRLYAIVADFDADVERFVYRAATRDPRDGVRLIGVSSSSPDDAVSELRAAIATACLTQAAA